MMNTAGDVSEQMVKMSLEGVELAARITGNGAKHVAAMLYSVLKEQKKTTGKMRLTGMLKSGKELKVFSIKREDLKRFSREAKRYGVLYCVLRDKDKQNPCWDIMVKAEDASKINRIFERFKFASVDVVSIKTDIENTRKEKQEERKEPYRKAREKSREEIILEKQSGKAQAKESGQTENPTMALTGKRFHRSEPSSMIDEKNGRDTGSTGKKPSVKKELEEIKMEQKKREKMDTKQKVNTHKAPKRKFSRQKKIKVKTRE